MSPLRILTFLTVVLLVLGGLHYYVWARLVRDTRLPPPWGAAATSAIVVLAILILVSFFLRRSSSLLASPVAWAANVWLGLVFFLFFLLLAADVAKGSMHLLRALVDAPPLDASRRRVLFRLLGGAVGLGAFTMGGVGLRNVLRPVGVKRVRVALPRFPADRSGYRIVQITDMHVGPTIGLDFVEEVVRQVNALDPDLVAITGDLVDGSVEDLRDVVAPLASLRSRDGVFFVTGNHEYYSGVREWLSHLPELGIRVLANERVPIGADGGFDLAGVHDWSARDVGGSAAPFAPDLPRALLGRDASRALVLLAHQPRHVEQAAEHGVDLQLSGHTHGGQLFPWGLFVRLQQPYVAGLHKHRDTHIYVSEGTGYWGPPMRVGTTAEITEIEIVRA